MEVISKREVKKKKKSRSSTFQKYHSHAGRKSRTLFLIVNLGRLKGPREPIPVVGVGDGCNSPAQLLARGLGLGWRGIRRVLPTLTRHSMTYWGCFLLWITCTPGWPLLWAVFRQPSLGMEKNSSPYPQCPNLGAWVGGGKAGRTASHRGPFIRIPPPPHSHAIHASLYRLCIQATP